MKMEIKPDTPLSVLLHIYPEAESVLREHFKDINFTSITERVKTLEDIAREGDIELEKVLNELKKKLAE